MFIIVFVIAAMLIYCLTYVPYDTAKQIWEMHKSGFLYNDDFEE